MLAIAKFTLIFHERRRSKINVCEELKSVMQVCGTHLVVEFCECHNLELLDNLQQIEQVMREGLKTVGFTLVELSSHKFTPIGVTSVAIVSESHVAIHTYPETGHACIDIFHCSDETQPLFQLMEFLKKHFKPNRYLYAELIRGSSLEVLSGAGCRAA